MAETTQETDPKPTETTETTETDQDFTEDVSMECQNEDSKTSDESLGLKPGETGKAKYTEEERLKRKEYFKQVREKRRQKYFKFKIKRLSDQNARNPGESDGDSISDRISFNMTEEDVKSLEFYKTRLTTLQDENEQLHKRIAFLVKENMRLLQKALPQ